jgi:hypothetical protein
MTINLCYELYSGTLVVHVIPLGQLGGFKKNPLCQEFETILWEVMSREPRMVETYRKAIGSKVWHLCSTCSTWPTQNYIESQNPANIEGWEVCIECTAHHRIGDHRAPGGSHPASHRTCPVIVNGKECGLELVKQPAQAGFYRCPLGHRTHIPLLTKLN